MGLNVSLIEKPCKTCKKHETLFSDGYTYNVSSMWYKIYLYSKCMVDIDGMSGSQASTMLEDAKDKMIDRKDELEKLNPENGWGSYDGFLEFINRVLDASKKYPSAIWYCDR